jgi:hypothetical protein
VPLCLPSTNWGNHRGIAPTIIVIIGKLFVPVNNPLIATDKNSKTNAGLRPATVFLSKSMKNLQQEFFRGNQLTKLGSYRSYSRRQIFYYMGVSGVAPCTPF